jgi:uncharacterized protein YjbI with pentapeptide repeats
LINADLINADLINADLANAEENNSALSEISAYAGSALC